MVGKTGSLLMHGEKDSWVTLLYPDVLLIMEPRSARSWLQSAPCGNHRVPGPSPLACLGCLVAGRLPQC